MSTVAIPALPLTPTVDLKGAALAEGELLVVLGPPAQRAEDRSPLVQELLAGTVPGMTRTHDYLSYQVGFLPNGGKNPYVVADYRQAGANALERRWLGHKLHAAISQTFNLKNIVVYLEAGSGANELAIVEDLWTRAMSPRYERSKLEGLRLLAAEPERLVAADPWRQARMEAQLNFRAWVNENPDELTSLVMGERLEAFCTATGCGFETLGGDQLTQLGLNLLLAVGQASDRSPPRLHLATYNLKPDTAPLLLVGKGITFDTGGINLKSHENLVNCMKNDMGGAGLLTQVFMALVRTAYPGPVVLAIPCCENLIDARAVKPGAIIRAHSGRQVLIEHTDAEGRLILADALSYAQERYAPALTITAATLTTASLRQFTNFFTPVHFARAPFQAALALSGAAWGEEFTHWGEFLPFKHGNDTPAADLTNMGRLPSHANMGGACNVAAHFLREFAHKAPFIHFDIFASTWNWSGDYPGAHYGATGAPLNSLFTTLRSGSPRQWGY